MREFWRRVCLAWRVMVYGGYLEVEGAVVPFTLPQPNLTLTPGRITLAPEHAVRTVLRD